MEALLFFIGIPILSGAAQFLVTRSRLPRGVKWCPALGVLLIALLCFLAMAGWVSLPETHWIDKRSFLAFPDYVYVWLFCFPVLFGMGIGAFFAAAAGPE